MNLHLGQFKFYCDQCKQGFSDSTHYKYHMNKHAGIMYRCRMCTKSFNSEEGRGVHMSVHTGVYRFTCNVCDQGFNQKSRYDKHCNEHLWFLVVTTQQKWHFCCGSVQDLSVC